MRVFLDDDGDRFRSGQATHHLNRYGRPVIRDFRRTEIADNGATVPVEVMSRLPGTKTIAIVVEKNPHPLSCAFNYSADAVPFVNTRIKIGETSNVTALVQTDQGFFVARRTVKVTLGGCGG